MLCPHRRLIDGETRCNLSTLHLCDPDNLELREHCHKWAYTVFPCPDCLQEALETGSTHDVSELPDLRKELGGKRYWCPKCKEEFEDLDQALGGLVVPRKLTGPEGQPARRV